MKFAPPPQDLFFLLQTRASGSTLLTLFLNSVRFPASLIQSLLATERIVLSSSNGHISSSSLLRAPSILASSRNGALTFSTLRSTTQTTLEALNGHISVSDLRSPLGTVDTKSGAVQGVYRVGKQLDLRTETGSIQADIYIEPTDDFELDVERPAHKHENEEQTDVRTFSVSATTRTGSVNLHYQSQPAHGVSLHSEAHSQTGSVSVTHARAYSGTFQLGSNVGSTEARRPESDVEDPAGERRERKWVIEKSRGGWGAGWTGSEGIGSTVEGKVWWEGRSGSDEREWGYSHMSARTGSVHAMFD